MKQPGRNEKCPCGSGRKYKHCCDAPPTEEQKVRWQHLSIEHAIGSRKIQNRRLAVKISKVPFSEIKPGAFFRIKGKALYQRGRSLPLLSQIVTGPKIGIAVYEGDKILPTSDTLVIPINATIVEVSK